MIKRGLVSNLENIVARSGAEATRVFRGAFFGSRYTKPTNAGTALGRRSALTGAPRSVFQGPTQIRSGAPVLKRL